MKCLALFILLLSQAVFANPIARDGSQTTPEECERALRSDEIFATFQGTLLSNANFQDLVWARPDKYGRLKVLVGGVGTGKSYVLNLVGKSLEQGQHPYVQLWARGWNTNVPALNDELKSQWPSKLNSWTETIPVILKSIPANAVILVDLESMTIPMDTESVPREDLVALIELAQNASERQITVATTLHSRIWTTLQINYGDRAYVDRVLAIDMDKIFSSSDQLLNHVRTTMPSKQREVGELLRAMRNGDVVEAWGWFGGPQLETHFGVVTEVRADKGRVQFSLDGRPFEIKQDSPLTITKYPGVKSVEALMRKPDFIAAEFGNTTNVRRLLDAAKNKNAVTIDYWQGRQHLSASGVVSDISILVGHGFDGRLASMKVSIGGETVIIRKDEVVNVFEGGGSGPVVVRRD